MVFEVWGIPGKDDTLAEVKGVVWSNYEGEFFVGSVVLMEVWDGQRHPMPDIKSARIVAP